MNIAGMIELLPSSVNHDLIDFKDGRLKVGNKTYDVTRMFIGHILTEEEKIALCDVVSRSKAEFIKTSTGFAGGGATLEDIQLFKKYVTGDTKIKAAGGIKSVADAEAFLAAGADRLGTSSLLAMLKQEG